MGSSALWAAYCVNIMTDKEYGPEWTLISQTLGTEDASTTVNWVKVDCGATG